MANLFVRKPLSELLAEAGSGEMPRVLGASQLAALGVGAVIGAGIFVLTGQAAAANAGPAIVLSFVLAGSVCALARLCYAELAAAVPVSGSAYTYAYATMGELVVWVIGWDLVLEYALSATTVAIGWSGYAVSALRGSASMSRPNSPPRRGLASSTSRRRSPVTFTSCPAGPNWARSVKSFRAAGWTSVACGRRRHW